MIKITKLEAEYIIETLDAVLDDSYSDPDIDAIENSKEILRACLQRDEVDAYKLEELDDAENEYKEIFDTETDANLYPER